MKYFFLKIVIFFFLGIVLNSQSFLTLYCLRIHNHFFFFYLDHQSLSKKKKKKQSINPKSCTLKWFTKSKAALVAMNLNVLTSFKY